MKKDDIIKKILLAAGGVTQTGDEFLEVGVDEALRSLGFWYKNWDRRTRYRIRKIFGELKRSGLIERPESNEEMKIILTDAGKRKMLWYRLKELKLTRRKRWDKKWRIVVFDIPENLKSARNILRKKLKEFGFVTLQRSIWVYPYECKNEIDFLTDFFGIKNYVNLIEATRIEGGEDKLKEHFRLKT